MTLLAQQMAERRERILQAARELIAEHGFEGLTMRELAQAAGVTVPTIYNLIGAKDEVLFAAVQEQTDRWVHGIERAAGDVMAVVDANVRELLRTPDYYRSLLRLLMASEAAGPARQNVGRSLRAQLRGALGELAEEGGVQDWIDLGYLQEQVQNVLWITSLNWSSGQIQDDQLVAQSTYGVAMLLVAATEGAVREDFVRIARECQPGGPELPDSNVTSLERRR